jgi:diguanylate cyclase (GGDEF)-like protein
MITLFIGDYKKTQLLQFAQQNSISITNYIISNHFEVEDHLTHQQIDYLDSKIIPILSSFDVTRVKLWDKDRRVLYSDQKELIGQQFEKGDNFAAALTGKTIGKYSHLDTEEHKLERTKNQVLLEVYTPLFNEGQEIVGVFELYFDVTTVEVFLAKNEFKLKVIVTILTMLLLFFIYQLSKSAAKVIDQSELEKDQAKDKLDLFLEITLKITSSLELEKLLTSITSSIEKYLGLHSVSIFMFNPGTNEFYLKKHSRHPDLDNCESKACLTKSQIIDKIKMNGIYIESIMDFNAITAPIRKLYKRNSGYLIPIKWKDELYGVILYEAEQKREFDSEELSMFNGIASQIGVAFRNSQLFQQVSKKATIDEMTQLYNYRYFSEKLDSILQKHTLTNDPLSLILIDIDHFKNINDTYGHLNGDLILKQVAAILKNSVRQDDIVARYGGEEFVVILESCPIQKAKDISERIRKSIEKYQFKGEKIILQEKITVSIGLSSFPDNGISKEQLINNSDKALYYVKNTGRNRVCAISELYEDDFKKAL